MNIKALSFQEARQITDNILVAYEILHSFKKKKEGPDGLFALKLYMYDKVEWSFIKKIMQKNGFLQWLN